MYKVSFTKPSCICWLGFRGLAFFVHGLLKALCLEVAIGDPWELCSTGDIE